MSIESTQKGHSLEKAVKFVQEAILESAPETKGIKFRIETNKRVTVDDVHHEIDVWVSTLPNSKDYRGTWIFECKNWAKPVGKNDVIILAEKVEAVQASHGFLVAKVLSRDAEAQLKRNRRLKFIPCTEDFLSPFNSAQVIHVVCDVLRPTVIAEFYGRHPENAPSRLDPKTVPCCLKGQQVNFLSFMNSEI